MKDDDAAMLTAELIRIEARVDLLNERFEREAGVARRQRAFWCSDLLPEDVDARLGVISNWVQEALIARNPEDRRRLRSCWTLHPAAVDEMVALYATWYNAYRDPRASPTAVPEYLDRWKPNALKRVYELLASCARGHTG